MGRCVLAGLPVVFNDFLGDPRARPWHDAAVQHGLRAAAALPIYFKGEVFGALNVYAGEADVFQKKRLPCWKRPPSSSPSPWKASIGRPSQRAERALRESEEKFRAIANYTVDWESWLGPDRKLLWVSPSVERITGFSAAECYAMPDYPLPLIAEEDRAKIAEMVRRPTTEGRGESLEFRIARKDGTSAGFPSPGNRSVWRRRHLSGASGRHPRHHGTQAGTGRIAQKRSRPRGGPKGRQAGKLANDIAANAVRWSDELYRIFDIEKWHSGTRMRLS